jgi:uncharacterized protein YjbJ (UPF0337 family)
MDWNRFEAQWGQYQAKVKQHFDKLTDDDLRDIRGKRDKLVDRLEKRYHYSKEEAQHHADEFVHAQEEPLVGEEVRRTGL